MAVISNLKRWHWMVIALVIGFIHGEIRTAARSGTHDRLDDYETLITNPLEFESSLVDTIQGRPRFADLVVYPYRSPAGRVAHLVTGRYYNGRAEWHDGQQVARWATACYVAPAPYRPATPLAGGAELPSVIDYLKSLHETAGLQYQYATFHWIADPLFISLCASVLLIGGVWPTLINLLTFGTFGRPREAKGFSPWNAASSSSKPPATAQVSPGANASTPLEKELEAMVNSSNPTPGNQDKVAVVTKLEAGPLAPTVLESPDDPKHFGAKKDDFYPTVLHPTPPQ